MSNFGAVLDACVLLPAAVRDTLLRAAEAGLYRPFWSHDILDEVERNLTKMLVRRGHIEVESKVQRLLAELRAQFPEATITGYAGLIPVMTNDKKDRHVLAVAVTSQAQAIVTDNLADFPASALAPYNLEAMSSDTFLTDLFDLNPDLLCAILEAQGQAFQQRKSLHDVLHQLQRHTPRFVAAVHRHCGRSCPC